MRALHTQETDETPGEGEGEGEGEEPTEAEEDETKLHVSETGATITLRQGIYALCRYTSALPKDVYCSSAARCVCVVR